MSSPLSFAALDGVPEINPGDSLVDTLAAALDNGGRRLIDGDVVAFCQKVVSKSENRYVTLDEVTPSAQAQELASVCGKDPRLVEWVLRESTAVVRCVKDVLIVRHRLGFVVANAAIDQSNIPGAGSRALLLPENPDASAARLRDEVQQRLGVNIAVIITDSFGRAWRMGVTGVCIGCAGLASLMDERGRSDRFGRPLLVTQIAVADALAAAAALAMGEADEGRPITLISGLHPRYFEADLGAAALIRASNLDLFK